MKSEVLTDHEREAMRRMLRVQLAVTRQSISDCKRNPQQKADQLVDAEVKLRAIWKVEEMINNAVRGAAEPRTLDGLVRPSGVSE